MSKILAPAAFGLALLMASGGAFAMSHESGKSMAREKFNDALNKCEQLGTDQRQTCMDNAMDEYREAREKEMMKK